MHGIESIDARVYNSQFAAAARRPER
eukprot:COSAG02_NODE_9945_length_2068_cov_3.272219_1_plen_25_part_10